MTLLLAKGANPNLTDLQGRTAADRAAAAGYFARARFLLKSGTKAENPSAFLAKARNPALRREISQGSVEAAKALLDQGADPNSRDGGGQTLLMIAADNDYSAAKLVLLLEHGALVNSRGPCDLSALMVATDH